MDKKQADFDAVTNPKRTLQRREDEAMGAVDTKKGVDAGDIPGPNADFFKPREGKSRTPPADMLKKHYGK
jgi:hypothetical protein